MTAVVCIWGMDPRGVSASELVLVTAFPLI